MSKPAARVENLCTHIVNSIHVEINSPEFNAVFRESVLCITKAISAFAFQHAVKPYMRLKAKDTTLPSAKNFRLVLARSRYFSLSLKLFTLRLAKLGKPTLQDAKALAGEYAIPVVDARRIFELWEADRAFRVALKKFVKPFPASTSSQWDEAAIESVFEAMYPRLRRQAIYLARRKLRFVVDSNNLEYDDIVNPLMSHVWGRYMQAMPTIKSPEHLLNAMRVAITNEVNNMCDKYTTQKSGRLVGLGKDSNNQHRTMLLVVSENQLPGFDEGDQSKFYDSLGSTNPYHSLDMELSVKKVLNSRSCSSSPKKQRLLSILMGAYDAEFTKWLHAKGHAHRNEENEEVQDRLPPQVYNRLVARHLKVAPEKAQRFLRSVGKQLAPDKMKRA